MWEAFHQKNLYIYIYVIIVIIIITINNIFTIIITIPYSLLGQNQDWQLLSLYCMLQNLISGL